MMWLLHKQPWFDLRAVWVIFSLDLVTQALVFAEGALWAAGDYGLTKLRSPH